MRFSKGNNTGFDDALIREAEGLEALCQALARAGVADMVKVPGVYEAGPELLVTDRVPAGAATPAALERLGQGLAQMHRLVQPHYGWETDNYIGLSPQPNRQTDDWGNFFVQDRLGYQVARVTDPALRQRFETLLERHGQGLAEWLNRHCTHPSLLHGDLWNGNVLFGQEYPWLIDPAVYCGDREADLAMTEMFGGFGAGFYQAYDRTYPRTPVYAQKKVIYNLYHYLNHYNLFGRSYLAGCEQGFRMIETVTGAAA